MQQKTTARGAKLLPLALIILFLLTRKKYELPEVELFVPNIPSSGGKKFTVQDLLKYVNIQFVTKPKIGWLLSLKPVYGVKIPINVLLPPGFLIAIPQIKRQLKDKVHIRPKTVFGILYGYDIKIDKISFWC